MKIRSFVGLLFIFYTIFLAPACVSKNWETPKVKLGYVNMYGKEVIPTQYDWAWPFSEGVAAVRDGSKYGFIDKEGQVQIPFGYDYAICFQEGLAVVGKDKKIGYIDREGRTVIPFEYEGGANFRNGIAGVVKDGKLGYIDREGNVVVDFIYDNVIQIGYESDGLIPVSLNKKWGYIDATGAVKIPFEFYRVNPFHAGMAYVSRNGSQYGFIDTNGDVIVPFIYQYTSYDPYKAERKIIYLECSIYSINYGHAYVGIITEEYGWNLLIGEGDRFSGGYALVQREGKYGFIDPEGNEVVPFEYDDAIEVAYGAGYVAKKDDAKTEWYRFNIPDFDLILLEGGLRPYLVMPNGDTYIVNERTDRYAFLDKDLNYKEFPNYVGLRYETHGFIISQDKKLGMIDLEGNILTPPTYDYWEWFSEGMAVVGFNVEK